LKNAFEPALPNSKQTQGQILAARQHMMPQVTAAHATYLQAEADFKAARGLD
jgi:hypothetical protein